MPNRNHRAVFSRLDNPLAVYSLSVWCASIQVHPEAHGKNVARLCRCCPHWFTPARTYARPYQVRLKGAQPPPCNWGPRDIRPPLPSGARHVRPPCKGTPRNVRPPLACGDWGGRLLLQSAPRAIPPLTKGGEGGGRPAYKAGLRGIRPPLQSKLRNVRPPLARGGEGGSAHRQVYDRNVAGALTPAALLLHVHRCGKTPPNPPLSRGDGLNADA